MEKESYISHWSALILMEVACLRDFFGGELAAAEKVEHHVVFSKKDLYQKKGRRVHLCSKLSEAPTQTIGNKAAVSAEMAFLQVAYELPIVPLILLGILMCSKIGPDDATLQTPQTPRTPQTPLTTQARIYEFVSKNKFVRGRRRALQATQYIRDNCRSPMEALMYMLLCLPNYYGGAGLTGSLFDYKVDLSMKDRRRLKKSCLYADLAFRESDLLLEYNSVERHSEEDERIKDEKRADVLRSMGYTVIFVEQRDLYDLRQFDALVRLLRKHLKKRDLRLRTEEFRDGLEAIRLLLPREKLIETIERAVQPERVIASFMRRFRGELEWYFGKNTAPQRSRRPRKKPSRHGPLALLMNVGGVAT